MRSTWLENDLKVAEGGPDDASLLDRVRNYDEDAMGELYDRYRTPIFQFVLHMSGDAAVAGDVTQDVFLLMLEASGRRLFSRFDPQKGSLEGYLLGVARNLTRKQMGWRRRWAPIEIELCCGAAVGEEVEDRLRLAQLRMGIERLPWKYREAIVLCCLRETSYEQAAAIAGCSVGTMASRLSRARSLLRQRFAFKSESGKSKWMRGGR